MSSMTMGGPGMPDLASAIIALLVIIACALLVHDQVELWRRRKQ